MSIMVGVGKGANLGLLIKSAEALERLEKVDTLVVDKTGTGLSTGLVAVQYGLFESAFSAVLQPTADIDAPSSDCKVKRYCRRRC